MPKLERCEQHGLTFDPKYGCVICRREQSNHPSAVPRGRTVLGLLSIGICLSVGAGALYLTRNAQTTSAVGLSVEEPSEPPETTGPGGAEPSEPARQSAGKGSAVALAPNPKPVSLEERMRQIEVDAQLDPRVTILPDSPRVHQEAMLVCSTNALHPSIEYVWSLVPERGSREMTLGTDSTISWVPSDSGWFAVRCEATNRRGMVASETRRVNVLGPPISSDPSGNSSPEILKAECEPALLGTAKCTAETSDADRDKVTLAFALAGGGGQVATQHKPGQWSAEFRVPWETASGLQVNVPVLWRATDRRGGYAFLATPLTVETQRCEPDGRDVSGKVQMPERLKRNIKLSPVLAVGACAEQVLSCASQERTIDGCMRNAVRCSIPNPADGDPAGYGCCPDRCVEAYFRLRKVQCAEPALQALPTTHCYPG